MDRYGNLTDPCLSRTINAAAIRDYIIPPLEYDKPFEGKLTEVRVEPDTINFVCGKLTSLGCAIGGSECSTNMETLSLRHPSPSYAPTSASRCCTIYML